MNLWILLAICLLMFSSVMAMLQALLKKQDEEENVEEVAFKHEEWMNDYNCKKKMIWDGEKFIEK